MTNIILSGANGRMGHVISDIVSGKETCEIVAGIDQYTNQYADFPIFSTPSECTEAGDVIIDFSNPSLLDSLLAYALNHRTPIVFATTGYSEEQMEKIKEASKQISIFFSFNMSLGINLLAELAKKAVQVLGDQFDIEIIEKHHNQKLDAPSGTAILLANAINEETGGKYEYIYDRHTKRQKRGKQEIGMHAVRGGTIVGEHEILFAGRDELITLSHSARSREVFAVGAVNAAIFLPGKEPGMYNMGDLMN